MQQLALFDKPAPIQRTSSRQSQAMQVLTSSETNEWYTPIDILESARKVLGGIELDPASSEQANRLVRADRYYIIDDDGLAQSWQARTIWLNPPYGKTAGASNQELWSKRLVQAFTQGEVQEAILLTKAAVGYQWFTRLWHCLPVCITDDCLAFLRPDGTPGDNRSKQASALFYLGKDAGKFVSEFRTYGKIIL